MKDRIPVVWAAAALTLCLSLPAFAQPAQPVPAPAPTDGKGPADPLSAEERIRRATVPPPGKDCAPDPLEKERRRQEAKHEQNLNFASSTAWTIERALEIAEREWSLVRTQLDTASRADWRRYWEGWQGGFSSRDAARAAFSPCKSPTASGAGPYPLTRSPNDGTNPNRKRDEYLGQAVDGSRDRPPASLAQGLLMAVVVAPFTRETQGRSGACPDGSDDCAKGPDQPVELLNFMVGLSGQEASAEGCNQYGDWSETEALFTNVRGRMNGGRTGAELLLASASNVPVLCSVEAVIERDGAELMRELVVFKGSGKQGGVVKETPLGFEPKPYTDGLTLNTACVPRVVWGGAGLARASTD